MFLSPLIHAVKSRLAVKLVLMFLVFGIVYLLLTMGFMVYQRSLLTSEILKRAQAQARHLALISRHYDVHSGFDKATAHILVAGVKDATGLDAFLIDAKGKVLAGSDTAYADSILALPSEMKTSGGHEWLTAGNNKIIRTSAPIEINVPIVNTDSLLYSYDKSDQKLKYFNLRTFNIQYVFSNFSPDSNHILCTLSIWSEPHRLLSVSIPDGSKRLLMNGGVSNGFWSNTGKYLVFNHKNPTSGKPPELSVYDINAGSLRIIANEGTYEFPNSCFTPDDQYIITSLEFNSRQAKLCRIPREGGKPVQLTFHSGNHFYPKCSPDGEWILYTNVSSESGQTRVQYAYNTKTKTSSRVFPGLEYDHGGGSFSPDGKHICYIRSTDITIAHALEIYVAEFPPDETRTPDEQYGKQLTFTGGLKWNYTDWSPDGEWITFSQRDAFQNSYDLCIVSPGTGEIRNLSGSGPSYKQLIGYAVLDIPMETINRAVANSNRTALAVGLIFTLVGMLGAFLLVRSIVRPVLGIADAADKVASGNLDQQVATDRNDEIGALAHSFNLMTGQLKISLDTIKTGSRELEQKHHELENAYRELDALDKAKDNFISLVSHEIRTPLSSIFVYAQMLKNGLVKSRETAHKYHATILDECERLTRLINDVLDLSKMEAGRMSFNLEALNVAEMVREIQTHFQPLLQSSELHFIDEGGPEDMRLLGDRDRIIQVLTNIVSNAIKFTPSGGTIRVSWKRDDGKGTVAVNDTGKGISEEDIPKVFRRFTQIENINHHTAGTGLGMAISKSIIDCLGGNIWIESTPGKGTTVFFSLPPADEGDITAKTETGEKAEEKPDIGMRAVVYDFQKVLIADDEEPIRVALSECTRRAGFFPITASDGREALRQVRLHHPAVVVLDVMMPETSGLEVCRKIRNDPSTREIAIIMLSARGQEKERQEGIEAGADRYITKPFNYEDVIKTIHELVGNKDKTT